MAQEPISNAKAVLMVTLALLFVDGINGALTFLNIIPVVGNMLALFATNIILFFGYMTYFFWFGINGIFPLRKARGVALLTFTLLIELIPFIKVLPAFSFWVFRVIAMSRIKKHLPQTTPKQNIHRIARRKARERITQQRPQQTPQEAV